MKHLIIIIQIDLLFIVKELTNMDHQDLDMEVISYLNLLPKRLHTRGNQNYIHASTN